MQIYWLIIFVPIHMANPVTFPIWDVNPDHLVGCTTYLHCISITLGSNELDSEQILDLSTRFVVFHMDLDR